MNKNIGLIILVGAISIQAQDVPAPEPGEAQRSRALEEIELPIPIQSPRALQPGQFEPLTAKEKFNRAVRNTFGPQAIANRLIIAGLNHWQDHPYEWSGNPDGYAMRFGSRMGRLAVRQWIQLGADVAFKTDPRYDRCNCSGFVARSGHAWKRVLVGLKDDGSDTVSMSRILGAYVPPIVTYGWYPDRLNTWSNKMQAGSEFLMWRGATNMLREFWPEISRRVPILKRKPSINMGE